MTTKARIYALKNIGLFTAAYLLVAVVSSIRAQNWEFAYYIAVVLILAACVLWVHLRVRLSKGVVWALSIWGLLHMAGGLVPLPPGWSYQGDTAVFYSWWLIPDLLKYDHVIHAYGFGVATVMCWQIIRSGLRSVQPTLGILVFCALTSLGLSALNEIVEFAAVLLIPDTNVGGYVNTGWDLVSNLVGTILGIIWILWKEKSSTSAPSAR